MQKDIFEDIRWRINCTYISDLKYYREEVLIELSQMELTEYQQKDLEDLKKYISSE